MLVTLSGGRRADDIGCQSWHARRSAWCRRRRKCRHTLPHRGSQVVIPSAPEQACYLIDRVTNKAETVQDIQSILKPEPHSWNGAFQVLQRLLLIHVLRDSKEECVYCSIEFLQRPKGLVDRVEVVSNLSQLVPKRHRVLIK
eukprot:2440851-Rhodomonas_salina.1